MTNSDKSLTARVIRLEHEVKQIKEELEEIKPFKEQIIRQDEHYNQIMDSLQELKEDVKQIKGRGARFWDYVIACIIAGVVGFLISKFLGI